jgi:hypothetical protein
MQHPLRQKLIRFSPSGKLVKAWVNRLRLHIVSHATYTPSSANVSKYVVLKLRKRKNAPPKREGNVPKYVVAAGVPRPCRDTPEPTSVVIKLRSDSPHMKKELT